jgi:hypothetical protein
MIVWGRWGQGGREVDFLLVSVVSSGMVVSAVTEWPAKEF